MASLTANIYSTNRGELNNRLRLYDVIITAVRAAVGNDFIVGVRLSQKKVNDAEYLWPEGQTAAQQVFALMKRLPVDYIHTTEPDLSAPAFAGSNSLSALAKLV